MTGLHCQCEARHAPGQEDGELSSRVPGGVSSRRELTRRARQEFQDPLSQLFDYAFRSDDWWYFPKKDDYIRADKSTRIGRLIAQFEWGDADSTPPAVAEGLCDA
ncbi:hypothetical protein AAL_01659 [Moelleriella libera RCEF 2490]|uniref:Uncharacterized protein n=1 Tax=Moelleriella libera RCEF 2490 TaxID=1081109 RepID=A0A166UBZ7_9HYPO|nr:hypothetical protein AAL_01659 [Moelleriella libera RCEF 2490]